MDSRPALATPIQSYAGHATVASKVSPTTEPPSDISGRHAVASDFKEYADTCTAWATSDHGPSRNLPPSSVSGLPYAMEWTTPSRPSTCSRTASARPARWDSSVTSSSSTGGSVGSRFAIRRVMPSARPKLEIRTVAPCSCATLAVAKPMELSIVTPATRIRLPSRIPMLSAPFPVHRRPG